MKVKVVHRSGNIKRPIEKLELPLGSVRVRPAHFLSAENPLEFFELRGIMSLISFEIV